MGDAKELAINEGTTVRTTPWPSRGLIGIEEKQAVDALFDEAIASGVAPGYNGAQEEAYCHEFADLMGGGFADAVNSGTTALYVALRALDLEPFTEIAVSCITDPGGMMPIPLLNCIPVPIDTAPGSYNVGPEQVEAAITPLTSAIVIAHIHGEPADMDGILAVARHHGIPVVEDCAQSHGATLHGRPVGTFGAVAAFSTMFGKHHCTGGQGGVVFTRSEDLYWRIRGAADRGKPFGLPTGSTNQLASLNFNLNEFACAIGCVQLRKLPDIVAKRRAMAARIREGLDGAAACSVAESIPEAEASYWKLRLVFRPDAVRCTKSEFCAALGTEGLTVSAETDCHTTPHLQDWFTKRRVFGTSGYPWASQDYKGDRDREFPCPNLTAVRETSLVLFFDEAWTEQEADDTVAILRKVEAAHQC
ncbi:MAG: DegT/DnrJ/EryC1/StrS family aminotransferase [Lentisphaeria bacterium]|nr:DegT/DnrJ/EryC1/StrS family aminotransferase [Lentisphaeria bacterium]